MERDSARGAIQGLKILARHSQAGLGFSARPNGPENLKKSHVIETEKGTRACALAVFSHLSKLSHGNLRFAPGLKLSMKSQQYFSPVGGAKFQRGLKLTMQSGSYPRLPLPTLNQPRSVGVCYDCIPFLTSFYRVYPHKPRVNLASSRVPQVNLVLPRIPLVHRVLPCLSTFTPS